MKRKLALGQQGSFSYRFFSMLWLLIIAVQWIDFTVPIWFNVTTSLVLFTLLVAGFLEIVLNIREAWKWVIKCVCLLLVWREVLVYYKVYIPYGPVFPDRIRGLTMASSPYIWFAIIAWALLEASFRLIRGRRRILLFLALHLLGFAILDSFTRYHLWGNVAWIVFAGLGWLLCSHFYEYRRKFPQGWLSLRRQPLKIAANIIVIFACVLLIGISMPAVSPILTDPYTAWKKHGGGGPAGNVPSASGSSATPAAADQKGVVSGYSQDDSRLGGSFEFDYTPVMSIETPVRSYWRGETRRIYSGKGWADLGEEPRRLLPYEGASSGVPLVNEQAGKVKTRKIEQTITMNTDQSYPVLFGGYSIESVELLDERGETTSPVMRWAARDAELFWGGYLTLGGNRDETKPNYPQKYKVVTEIPIIPLEKLERAAFDDLYPGPPDRDYLQLPSSLPKRVRDLAEEVTAEADTPYRKAELLQAYLRQNFEYTNRPDLTRKKSRDFVDGFLFEIKQGYCDYYSTAMVVMARSLGIPARWVKGYAPGSMPNEDMMLRNRGITGETSGEYLVNNSDAHSWAELYFGDYGWIPFEPTPGFDAPMLLQEDESGLDLVQGSEEETGSPTEESDDGGLLASLDPGMVREVSAIAAAIIAVWGVYRLRARLYFGWLRLRMGRPLTSGEKTVFETLRVVRKLRRKGLRRTDQETMRETFIRWKLKQPELSPVLDQLLARFEKASYSPDAVSPEEWLASERYSRELLKLAAKDGSK